MDVLLDYLPWLVVLVLLGIVLRFVFHLARRVLILGCGLLVFAGLAYLALEYLR